MSRPSGVPTSSPNQYGLVKVSRGVWFVPATEDKRPVGNDTDPTLILIFGWMDAKSAHLAKFSAGYSKVFPYSNQIIMESPSDMFIFPNFVSRRRLIPVLNLMNGLGVTSSESITKHRILCHCLSNGGTWQLKYLSDILPKHISDVPIPNAIISDSAPGGDDIKSVFHVMSTIMPNPIIRYPVIGLMFLVHIVGVLVGVVSWRLHNVGRFAYRNPTLLPWINKGGNKTPYLYIYSKADKSVPFNDIQSHTELAESEGQNLTRLIYEDSPHVGHMRSDPVRYWGAVQALWKRALKPFN